MPARQASRRRARLEAGQVRAMFDRIAGVYDLMNTAMTAGLHHRWRARAADLAQRRPGQPRARRGHRHRRPRARAGPPRVARRRGRRQRLRRGRCSTARARRPAAADERRVRPRFEWGDALALPYDDDSFDAATVGFGARNFDDLARGPGGDGARRAPRRPGRGARDHHAARARRCRSSTALWFDRIVPALGRAGGPSRRRSRRGCAAATPTSDDRRRLHLPAELGQALPRPRGARRRDGARGPRRDPLPPAPPAGSSRSTRARCRARGALMSALGGPARERARRRRPTGSTRSCAAAASALRERMARTERHLERVTARGRRAARRARQRDGRGGRQAPAPAARAARRRVRRRARARPPTARSACVRAAVAVELVHSATLVHDDLIDGAQLRRGHPTVAAIGGRRGRDRDRRPAVLARVRRARAQRRRRRSCSALSEASSALAEGELLQREDAYAAHVAVERYLRRCELKTAALFEAACRLGALAAPTARRSSPTRSARSRGGSGWPSRCSTTCSTSPGPSSAPASRAAPTCSTAPSRCR